MQPTIVITTYKSPRALRLCLLGFLTQSHRDFQIIVAEDSMDRTTKSLLREDQFCSLNIRHLSQVDDGFRKCLLLNRALAICDSDYVIFCDGDCIPRDDFVETHLQLAKPNHFLSGNRIEIPEAVHKQFNDGDVLSGLLFDRDFLPSLHQDLRRRKGRLIRNRKISRLFDLMTRRRFVFSGSNASAWRKDLVRVNGFDESFLWSKDDRDLGARLKNAGVKSSYAKYSLVQLHLGHGQPYVDEDAARRNRVVFQRRFNGTDKTTAVENGIDNAWDRADRPVLESMSLHQDSRRAA